MCSSWLPSCIYLANSFSTLFSIGVVCFSFRSKSISTSHHKCSVSMVWPYAYLCCSPDFQGKIRPQNSRGILIVVASNSSPYRSHRQWSAIGGLQQSTRIGKRLPQIHTRIVDIHSRQMGRYDGPSGLIADISGVQATQALSVGPHLPRTQLPTTSEH